MTDDSASPTRLFRGAPDARLIDAPVAEVQVSSECTVAAWAESFRASGEGEVLPPHSPRCVGCGPDNPHGLGLVVRREGDGVVAEHSFDARHVGAPGVAHGGTVAMAFDDLFGFVLYLVGELAVTRDLQIGYLAPVRLDTPYVLRATYGERAGRRLPVSGQLCRPDGAVIATAAATFVIVDAEHFTRAAGPA